MILIVSANDQKIRPVTNISACALHSIMVTVLAEEKINPPIFAKSLQPPQLKNL